MRGIRGVNGGASVQHGRDLVGEAPPGGRIEPAGMVDQARREFDRHDAPRHASSMSRSSTVFEATVVSALRR